MRSAQNGLKMKIGFTDSRPANLLDMKRRDYFLGILGDHCGNRESTAKGTDLSHPPCDTYRSGLDGGQPASRAGNGLIMSGGLPDLRGEGKWPLSRLTLPLPCYISDKQ